MKRMTRPAPRIEALIEALRASSASVGPTSYICSSFSSTSRGLLRTLASSRASRWEKWPEMTACPPGMGSLTRGAE